MNVEKIGLIGLGKHGRRYADHIERDFPQLSLHAICRRNAQLLSHEEAYPLARRFEDYRDLISDGGCDAIIAVVPPHLNLEIVRRAARSGTPLLLEKPAAATLANAHEMSRVLAENPIPLMVAQTLRYNAVVRCLRGQIGAIGRVTSISLTQRFEPSSLDWLDDPAQSGAGIALHTGVHSFDLLRHLTGLEARSVTAQMASIVTRNTEDNCAATVELEGSVLASVTLARTAGGRTGHIEIAGEYGTLVGDHVLNRAHIVRGRDVTVFDLGEPVPTVRQIVGDFVRCVERGEPIPIPLADGVAAIAVAHACLESAACGKRVDVPRVGG